MAEDFSTWTKDGEDFSTWVKDEPAPETGYVKGVAQSLGRGIAGAVQFGGDYLQDNPEYMASGSSEATRDQSKLGILNKIGRTVSDTAESVKNYIPQPVHGGKGFKRSVFEGVESIPTSMALQVPAVAATYAGRAGGALLGAAGGPVGAVAGGVSGGVGAAVLAQSAMSRVMHSATRQQTLEELDRLQANGELRDGVTQAEKIQAADEAARAEWQGELPSSIVESLIYSKLPAGRTLSTIIKPGIKQFAKNMAMTLPLELGGEAYTAHEQSSAMNSVLAPERKTSPTQAAVDSLGPTAVMTAIMGGAGTMGQRFNGRGIAAALQNPNAPVSHRKAAADVAANYIKSNIGEREAANFRSHALDAIGNAEQTGTDPYALNLDNPELLSTLKTKPATDEDLMATATEALTRAASGESLSDAIEELNAAKVEEKLAQDDALAQALSLGEAPASQELPTPLPTPIENIDPPPQVDPSTGELLEENPVIDWLNSLPFKERNKLIKKATDSPIEAQEYLRRKYEEAVNPAGQPTAQADSQQSGVSAAPPMLLQPPPGSTAAESAAWESRQIAEWEKANGAKWGGERKYTQPSGVSVKETNRRDYGESQTVDYSLGDTGHAQVVIKDGKAHLQDIQIGYDGNAARNTGAGTKYYEELGRALAEQGVVLESTSWSRHQTGISPQALRVWEKLEAAGLAVRTGTETGKVYNRETGEEVVKDVPTYEFKTSLPTGVPEVQAASSNQTPPEETKPAVPRSTAEEIARTMEMMSGGMAGAAHENAVDRFKKEGGLQYFKPETVAMVQQDPRYNVTINQDGSATVNGILDTRTGEWVKLSPVPAPSNPAFLGATSEEKNRKHVITQPKAEPVTDKDVPAMLDAISEAYDNGHAMEDYAPENFGKVDGKVYITDTDSMTPLDSPDVVHGSKEELMAAAKNKLTPAKKTSQRHTPPQKGLYRGAELELDANGEPQVIAIERPDGVVGFVTPRGDVLATASMGSNGKLSIDIDQNIKAGEAQGYLDAYLDQFKNGLTEDFTPGKGHQNVAAQFGEEVKFSAKGQSDALQQTSNNSATGRVPTRSELSGEAGSVQTDNKADTGTPRSIRSILATAESDTGGAANATGGSTSVTALQSAGGGVQSAVAPFSLRTAAERLGFLNKTVISKRTGKLYAPGTFRESKDRSLRDRLAEIAGIFGHDVTLMANIPGGDFDGGVAAADKRNIYILESVENPHIAVLGHELVHQIEQNNRPLYVELATAFAELKDDAGFAKYMSKYHKVSAVDGKLVVPSDVSEEWVGDVLGLGMTRQSFWDAFYEHSPSLAQRIAQLVKEFLARISGKLNGRIMKSEATIKDFKAVDREASRILKKYAESQKDAGGVDGPGFKRLASEKGTQNEKDKFTASILAGASGEAQGSNLGDAQTELARMVGERVYDGRITSPRARKTVEAKALRAWAKAQGLLNDGSAFETEWRKQTNSEGKRIKGNEHDVIFNGDGTVTKRNHLPGTYHVSYKELFDRVALFNYLFGGDATLTLTGFQDTPDGLLPEFSQKDLGGGVARIEQTEKMLSGAGFEPVGNKTTAYRLPGTDIIITDVFGENTRQVGDVTVPMDYVIFHGERARSWLKAQEKVELPEFDEAEFDKGFDAAMKFSATELSEGKNLAKNVTEWFKSFPYLRVLEDATNTAYRWLMPVDRVVNLAASQKDYTPIKNLLLRYISQKAEKSGYTSSAMNDAHHVNQRIDKAFKTEADQKNLQDLVWKATTYELHADPNRHNDWTAKSWEDAGMLEATGKSLGAALKEVRDAYAMLNPEQMSAHSEMLDLVNQMYHDGRRAELAPFELAYGKELVAKADAYKGSVEAAPADIKDVLPLVRQVNDRYPTLKGDYMPLMRFGQYAVRTYAVDENGEMGERTRTEFFENAEDALVYVREINEGSSGLQAKLETRPDVRRDVVNIPGSFLDKLRIAAEKRGFTGEALDSLMQDAEGLRANVLPRTSVVGNKLRREGVEGYNQNVTRVFAAYVRNHASANARLIHGTKIEQTFRDIGNEIDAYSSNRSHDPNAAKNMHLLKDRLYELERSGNNEKINKFTKAVGKMTFVWYLASPSVWAVQWSQPFMTTIPKMAARFGFGTSFGAYTSAAKEYMQGKYSDEKIDEFDRAHEYVGLRVANLLAEGRESDAARKREIDQEIKGLYDSFNVSDRKLLVLKVLAHQGMIDLSSAHSLQDLISGATDGDKLVNKAIEKAAFFMQKSETGSRRAAAVSAFELAFKDGKGFTAANDYTTDIIRDTLADFSSQNRAAWMRGNAGRILGQFQFFRLHMVGKLIQLSKDAIGGEYQRMIDDANGDQAVIDEAKKKRSEARKELAYMIGSSFALAGAGGTPVALALSNTATSALWSALAFMFGDDDDPWDPKRDFEVMVRESMGDVAGGVVLKGLPSLVGADISRRIGMGGMANIISGDPPAGLTGTAKANWYAGRILGPAWGVASDGLRTFDAIKEGDLSTVLSAGSPKVIKDFVKALGVSAKGIQAGGKTILQADDVSPYSIALMLSGINPLDVSLAQEESRYVKNLSTEMSQRRSKLIRDVARANVDGEDTGDALAAVSKWTATHPKLGITAQELASGIKKERKSRLGLLTERERLVKEGA